MSNPLISIIIPTYNVESYIARCLDSCINQTLSDIEILIIDDCGSDDSIQIAKEYASKDSRIKIIHNEKNLGLFQARLQGEKVARGEYILCLDSDDYIDTRTCKILYQTIYPHAQNNILYKNIMGGGQFMNAPKISIIIPMYNVRKYIARCLDSCINQTLSDIEILVIDDCGSDDSIQIAKEYASKDSRIKIIHNEKNLGTFNARLRGMQQAQGEYIMFVDADDYLSKEACQKAYNASTKDMITKTQKQEDLPDIIHFKASYIGDKNASLLENLKHKVRYILPTQWSKKPLRDSEIAYNFFLKSKHFPKFTLWDKCYKASLIKETLSYFTDFHTSLNMAEDMLKFFVIVNLAKNYASIDERLYMYCLNTTSITQHPSARKKKIDDMHTIMKAMQNITKKLNAPYAPQIAQTMIAHLQSLIILESRFDTSCVDGTKGGGDANIAESTLTDVSRFLSAFAQILESLSYLHSYICVYPKLWTHKALKNTPNTESTHYYFVEVA